MVRTHMSETKGSGSILSNIVFDCILQFFGTINAFITFYLAKSNNSHSWHSILRHIL